MRCPYKPLDTGIIHTHSIESHQHVLREPIKRCTSFMGQIVCTETIAVTCKYCQSKNVVKNGKKDGYQYYLCKDCGHTFAYNNATPGMRYPPQQIASALSMFYEGLSIDAIRRELDQMYKVYPSDSTVYEWVVRFTKVAVEQGKITNVKVGDTWIADETVLKLDSPSKDDLWFWDIIDDKTRFLLASHMSFTRSTQDAKKLMQKAFETADKSPKVIITDKLRSYLDGIELTFGADTKHKQGGPFDIEKNTNLIERFHGTLKARTKVMRGMHNKDTARLIMDGWLVHYNFFRPHEALNNRTPGEVAKADFPFKNWIDVVQGVSKDV